MTEHMIILGILLSILYYELTEISPGGMIVPGYLVLFLDQPARIAVTVGISLITLYGVNWIAKFTILYGKRKFALMILVSFVLRYFWGKWILFSGLSVTMTLVIGYLIPGILAMEMDRQGSVRTLSSLFIVIFTLKFVLMAFERGNIL